MSTNLPDLELRHWACESAKICPDKFECFYYNSCSEGVGLEHGNTVVMSYIGKNYYKEDNFKIAIIGIDHGGPDHNSFSERREVIESHYQKNPDGNFNPHYKGVVKTAAVFLGNKGAFCLGNCVHNCNHDANPQHECVIDKIAQPNLVKCVPINAKNRTSVSTTTMKKNCVNHLIEELRILEPKLIIVHGSGSRVYIERGLSGSGNGLSTIDSDDKDLSEHLYRIEALSAHILFLPHPAHNWLNRVWGSVVLKAVDYLKSKQAIPE
ncbi:uracil-DNA glycosylase family protein [Acidithiobacillus ferrooxidans]|uniref:uracil-DNA glycosylase family protein n=1 Tax=Acidithiobacillus ferrooxidans TaxID=920 RepID=UPI0021474E63|nr:uracil-DNA glycosylase family protein [Acidithiobacillus ferrooxidans]MCR1347044.1 uracil-DNA glycosylase family protein [Acidithiobacillus ferrooxidans]MCR1355893.1 uracil-DNA glycosylase family protein [Acidithiobacillus ferrooxidans]